MGCGTPAVPSERSLAPSSLPIEQSNPPICFPFLMSATPQFKGETAKVAALETQISKSTTATTITSATATTTSAIEADAAVASSTITATTAITTTTPITTASSQVSVQSPSTLLQSQQRPVPAAQNESKPKQRKLQFKLDDEGSPDKKPKEKLEEENCEEEESGWWAERVAIALGGMPEYRDAWYKSHAHLLHGDGPLPHTWRLYVAALAICRHEVNWLMQALIADFRNAGGDMRWTVSIHHAPPKLYALTSINNILAHRPWLLSSDHIKQLTKGEDSWSLGELCQALCIMTHFHALASFLHGCKLSSLHSPSKKEDGQANTVKPGSSNKIRTPCLDTVPKNNNTPCELGKLAGSTSDSTGQSYRHLTVNPTYSYEDIVCKDNTRVPSFFVQRGFKLRKTRLPFPSHFSLPYLNNMASK
ncbi:Sestrin-2 [Halocaridina rubra]|uniref:Sestrin-2 n=1 Tax=Halocaridina rubra TaxID=373956 RepID=A0AAN8XHH2_HALRR